MNDNYKILLLGEFYDNHTIRFVRNLKAVNSQAQIDYFTPRIRNIELPVDYLDYFRNCNIVDFTNYFKYIPILKGKEKVCNWHKHFRAFVQNKHYDIVNIHYPRSIYSCILSEIRSVADNIVLTPWGSDVLRANNKERKLLQKLYDAADYVTGHGDRFTDDFMSIFNIPKYKFAHADLGSETIDYIVAHKDEINVEQAKQHLGIEGRYAITCGYNASPAQQHIQLIETIGKLKNHLPQNLILLFPVTYPKNTVYVNKLKEEVEKWRLPSLWFEQYLDLESLFVLRQATDMFIHVQTTDANNASLREYLLLGKNCLNGNWMNYPDLEKDGNMPYHGIDNLNNLDEAVLNAYRDGAIELSEEVRHHIESLGCRPAAEEWNSFFMSICK